MANIVEGKPWIARVKDIKSAEQLGGNGDHPVAIARWRQQIGGERKIRTGFFPLANNQILTPGDEIEITPITEYIGKGSVTTYRLSGVARIATPFGTGHPLG